jgi:hypothetical protein
LIKECRHCEIEFEVNSPHKKRVGGKINECADCVEELETETVVKYLGVVGESDGSTCDINILAFTSDEARAQAAVHAGEVVDLS